MVDAPGDHCRQDGFAEGDGSGREADEQFVDDAERARVVEVFEMSQPVGQDVVIQGPDERRHACVAEATGQRID